MGSSKKRNVRPKKGLAEPFVELEEVNETVRNSTLLPKQENVAICLASGMTVAATSRKCEIGTTTIWQWKKQSEFNDRVDELRKALTSAAVGRLANLIAIRAPEVLATLLEQSKPNATRLEVVKAVYELYGGLASNLELVQIVEQLKAKKR